MKGSLGKGLNPDYGKGGAYIWNGDAYECLDHDALKLLLQPLSDNFSIFDILGIDKKDIENQLQGGSEYNDDTFVDNDESSLSLRYNDFSDDKDTCVTIADDGGGADFFDNYSRKYERNVVQQFNNCYMYRLLGTKNIIEKTIESGIKQYVLINKKVNIDEIIDSSTGGIISTIALSADEICKKLKKENSYLAFSIFINQLTIKYAKIHTVNSMSFEVYDIENDKQKIESLDDDFEYDMYVPEFDLIEAMSVLGDIDYDNYSGVDEYIVNNKSKLFLLTKEEIKELLEYVEAYFPKSYLGLSILTDIILDIK